YWLGSRYLDQQRDAEAVARFVALERRFPASEWAGRAKRARADLLLHRRHPLLAQRLYRELAASPNPIARAAGQEGLADVRATLVRLGGLALSLAYLIAFAVGQLVALGGLGRLRRVPDEVL